MNISIIGGGYVGLVTGVCLATLNHTITIIDIDEAKIDAINNKTPSIYEDGLEQILQMHVGINLTATSAYVSIQTADIIIIAVGTPPNPNGSANLAFITAATDNIGKSLATAHTEYPIIVVKSTVPPGTTKNLVCKTIRKKNPLLQFGCCMNPEFLREGRAIEDFVHPDRIVIGSTDEKTIAKITELYKPFGAPIITVDSTAAEMIKYTSNALLATKISFSNEIGNLCKALGVDVYEVMKGVGLDHRISPHFLDAGAGFGGSCFPKDVSAIVAIAKKHGVIPTLLEAVLQVNDLQPLRMIKILSAHLGDLKGTRIAVLGLAFKDNTDDIRESRSIPVIAMLLEVGAHPVLYDPMATENMKHLFPQAEYAPSAVSALTGSDGCLVMTEWSEFATLDAEFNLMKQRIIIDGRHILKIKDAEGICW